MWPFRQRDDIPSFEVASTLGAKTHVCGGAKGPGGFRIEGTVEGDVESDGPVIVGERGAVEGNIRARDVVVLGAVRGGVHASGHLEIGPKGKVTGDVSVQSFRMHKGGVFRGVSHMPASDETDAPPATLRNDARPALPIAPNVPAIGAVPALEALDARRGRTLPPPNGAVVPPPSEEAESLERLVVARTDDEAATGT